MTPTLVTAATGPVVPITEMREHLRVDGVEEDYSIAQYETAAVAYLDGFKGILGRAILPQTWSQEFDGWGELRLALPDVSSVTVTDDDGAAATTATICVDGRGWYVDAEGTGPAPITVEYTCGMSAAHLAVAKMAIKLLVGHWFESRQAASAVSISSVPMAFDSLVSSIRWNSP